ncbi:MAG TPA: class I SAM-dependent methyltransferase [Solirubrobacteraceae bacterium]|nr:class I SAM-dependent methyltransferase [Solirubrobacteraceae bacterium]
MGLLSDYSKQALAYDRTRAASPSVLAPVRLALAGAPGRKLVDIGGGTGNYSLALADEGWRPVVVDREPSMLARAAAKRLHTVDADATRLPFADESFDAAMLVSMLHHVDAPEQALAEARRVLRPGGRLAIQAFTREDIADAWCLDYFPSSRAWMYETHTPLAQLLAELPGARHIPVVYSDLQDGSMAALLAHPELLLERERRAQTSYFERMERDHPDELRAGLQLVECQLAAADGSAPTRVGRASVLAWVKPASGGSAETPP